MALHQARATQNPQFLEVQRLVRDLLRTVGLPSIERGQIVVHIAAYQANHIEFRPPAQTVVLGRTE